MANSKDKGGEKKNNIEEAISSNPNLGNDLKDVVNELAGAQFKVEEVQNSAQKNAGSQVGTMNNAKSQGYEKNEEGKDNGGSGR